MLFDIDFSGFNMLDKVHIVFFADYGDFLVKGKCQLVFWGHAISPACI